MTCGGRKKLTATSDCGETSKVTGSDTMADPGGISTVAAPPCVIAWYVPLRTDDPLSLMATCASVMVSGSLPNSLVNRTRICLPPIEICAISRSVTPLKAWTRNPPSAGMTDVDHVPTQRMPEVDSAAQCDCNERISENRTTKTLL